MIQWIIWQSVIAPALGHEKIKGKFLDICTHLTSVHVTPQYTPQYCAHHTTIHIKLLYTSYHSVQLLLWTECTHIRTLDTILLYIAYHS